MHVLISVHFFPVARADPCLVLFSVLVRVISLPSNDFDGLASVIFGADGKASIPLDPNAGGDDDVVEDEVSQGTYVCRFSVTRFP